MQFTCEIVFIMYPTDEFRLTRIVSLKTHIGMPTDPVIHYPSSDGHFCKKYSNCNLPSMGLWRYAYRFCFILNPGTQHYRVR